MKKSIFSLGKILSKKEQKLIHGGMGDKMCDFDNHINGCGICQMCDNLTNTCRWICVG